MLNVIILGQTISDHNKWMITLTEFTIPINKPVAHLMGLVAKTA